MIDETKLEASARRRVFLSWVGWFVAIFFAVAAFYCASTGLAHLIGWCLDGPCAGPFYGARHILPAFGMLVVPGVITAIVIVNVLEPRLKKDVEAMKQSMVEREKARTLSR